MPPDEASIEARSDHGSRIMAGGSGRWLQNRRLTPILFHNIISFAPPGRDQAGVKWLPFFESKQDFSFSRRTRAGRTQPQRRLLCDERAVFTFALCWDFWFAW